jgi:hypothetical protein
MLKLILMKRFQKMCSLANTRFSHADETERGEVSRQLLYRGELGRE